MIVNLQARNGCNVTLLAKLFFKKRKKLFTNPNKCDIIFYGGITAVTIYLDMGYSPERGIALPISKFMRKYYQRVEKNAFERRKNSRNRG